MDLRRKGGRRLHGIAHCARPRRRSQTLSLCFFIAAVVASELSGVEIAAVYTSAEDKEAIVHVDMRPLKIVHVLKDSRSTTKRRVLLEGKVEGRCGGEAKRA